MIINGSNCRGYEAKQKVTSKLLNKVKSEIDIGRFEKKNLVWLELTGCSGNIISLLNGANPDFQYLISQMVNMYYSNSLMAAEGEKAMQQLSDVMNTDYILAVEGAVATKNNGFYNIIGRWNDKPLTALEAVKMLGGKASHVIAVGACATHGGVSAARPNPAECVSVQSVLNRKVIKLTGCPCHPDWFMGTLAHILLYGEPELDNRDRPLLYYSTLIHDKCPRRIFLIEEFLQKSLVKKLVCLSLGAEVP